MGARPARRDNFNPHTFGAHCIRRIGEHFHGLTAAFLALLGIGDMLEVPFIALEPDQG